MSAIENLYTTIATQFPNERITTKQVANAVGLTRSVVSGYLSKLNSQDKIQKVNGRPVYWQIKQEKTAFSGLIGSNGSLRSNISRAIEAIVYPPNGLPVFITGPEGSGKTAFALAIFHESIRRKEVDKTSSFSQFDCANYQGRFDELKKKLEPRRYSSTKEIPKKVQFILLQKVQVLPDHFKHYLVDYLSHQEKGTTRYIFSSSDNTFTAPGILSKTAAVRIQTVPYSERPFSERIEFVARFLQDQANKLNRDLLVDPKEFIRLTKVNHVDTITALYNHIKLLGAEAYTRSNHVGQLAIGSHVAQPIVVKANQPTAQAEMNTLIKDVLQLRSTTNGLFRQLTDSLQNKEPITEQNFLVFKVLHQIDTVPSHAILSSLAHRIHEQVVDSLTKSYGLAFPKDPSFWETTALGFIYAGLCSDEFGNEKQLQSFRNEIKRRYPRSLYLFDKLLEKLDVTVHISVYFYLPFFLIMNPLVKKIEEVQYNAIIAAHGETTASSIQQVANSLCGNYFFEAFDMPVEISVTEISLLVKKYLTAQSSTSKGTIVLFDMGSLSQMFSTIKKVSGQELIVINNVTTAMALDIGLRVQRNESFHSIAEASNQYGQATGTQYFEGLSDKPNVIVSCLSGVGLSEELKRIMDLTLSPSIEVITLDYRHLTALLANNDQSFFSNTELILTTTDVRNDIGIETVNVYNIFDQQSASSLRSVLAQSGETPDSISKFISQLLRYFSLEGIKSRLQFLNPDIIIQEVQDIVAHYESFYGVSLSPKLKLNLYMHLSLMIERMMMKQLDNEDPIDLKSMNKTEEEFFSLSKGILQPVQNKFNLTIDDYEITLLYQLLKDYIH